jgi:hypothetical protein
MFWIPKIEWAETTKTGDTTNGNPTIGNLTSTADIFVGMNVSGSGIPLDAQVISKTANSVTLNTDAISSASSVSLVFKFVHEFIYPPVSDTEEKFNPRNTASRSLSGLSQVVTNYIEVERNLEFGFINQTDADKLKEKFYLLWASKGNEFTYWPDKDEAPFYIYELSDYSFERVRQIKKHPNFKYLMTFKFRRSLDA